MRVLDWRANATTLLFISFLCIRFGERCPMISVLFFSHIQTSSVHQVVFYLQSCFLCVHNASDLSNKCYARTHLKFSNVFKLYRRKIGRVSVTIFIIVRATLLPFEISDLWITISEISQWHLIEIYILLFYDEPVYYCNITKKKFVKLVYTVSYKTCIFFKGKYFFAYIKLYIVNHRVSH